MTAKKRDRRMFWWKNLKPLNDEQRDRVESCAPMLYSFVNRASNVGGLEWDQAYGEALRGLIHASLRYSTSRGVKWSTYAASSIKGRIARLYWARRTGKIRLAPLQFAVDENGEMFSASNIEAPAPANETDITETLDLLMGYLPSRMQTLIRCRLAGFTLRKTGNRMRICCERVRQLESRAIERMRSVAERLGLECPC